jgi:hypothetical protein
MIPVKQRNKHDPVNGIFGDCHRAAMASVLELPLEEVTHFADGGVDGDEFMRREKEFLLRHGLVPIYLNFRVATLDEFEEYIKVFHHNLYYLIGGASSNGTPHTVVGLNGKIVHDPNGAGIIGPLEDVGCFVLTFFGSSVALSKEN